eukprot:12750-Lingulodinium_polyedra.AAC.1
MEQHRQLFRALAKAEPTARGLGLHETLAGLLHLACSYDQLDVDNLAWAESASAPCSPSSSSTRRA